MDKWLLIVLIVCGVAAAALAIFFLVGAGQDVATIINK